LTIFNFELGKYFDVLVKKYCYERAIQKEKDLVCGAYHPGDSGNGHFTHFFT